MGLLCWFVVWCCWSGGLFVVGLAGISLGGVGRVCPSADTKRL